MSKQPRTFREIDQIDLVSHQELLDAAKWFVETHQKRFNEEPRFAIAGEPTDVPPMESPFVESETSIAVWTVAISKLHALGLTNSELLDLITLAEPNPRQVELAGSQAILVTDGLYALVVGLTDFLSSLVHRAKLKKEREDERKQTVIIQIIGIAASLLIAWGVAVIVVSDARIESESFDPLVTELRKIEAASKHSDNDRVEQLLQELIDITQETIESTEAARADEATIDIP